MSEFQKQLTVPDEKNMKRVCLFMSSGETTMWLLLYTVALVSSTPDACVCRVSAFQQLLTHAVYSYGVVILFK
jgi:hypothetical protein